MSCITIYGIMQYLQAIYCMFGEFYCEKCGNINIVDLGYCYYKEHREVVC